MSVKENLSDSLESKPVLIEDDSRANSEERTTIETEARQENSSTLCSSETCIEELTKKEEAFNNAKNKQLSESEIALKTLQSKLKEVQTKLNLNSTFPGNFKSLERNENDTGISKKEIKKKELESTIDINDGTEKSTKEPKTPKALRLNVESARQSQFNDDSGNANTPQKQVAEAWKSVGLQRCRFCKFSTDIESLFKQHAVTCTPKVSILYSGGVYTCETCDLTWTNIQEFEEHIVCHTTEQPYVCLKCKKVFESRMLIEQHAKTDHPAGGSVYGVRGMKKSRKIVEELEGLGKYQFRGKIDIPLTPRNKHVVGLNDSTGVRDKSDVIDITGEQTIHITNVSNIATSESRSAASTTTTTVSSASNCVPVNSALIEKSIEDLRQYIISTRGSGFTESNGQLPGNHTVSKNDIVKPSEPKDAIKPPPLVIHTASVSRSEEGVTIQDTKEPNLVSKELETLATTILLSPVSQPLSKPMFNPATNTLTISSQPNTSLTVTQKFDYNPKPGIQTCVSQPPRQYQFSEYTFPPPPRPRIPVASVAPSPVVQTSGQTIMRSNPAQVAPTVVQAKSGPFVLIPVHPIQPVFNPPEAVSNVLIPVAPVTQSTSKPILTTPNVHSTVAYHVPPTVCQSNTIRYPVAPLINQPVTQVVVQAPQSAVPHVGYPVQISSHSNSSVQSNIVTKAPGKLVSLVSSVTNASVTSKPDIMLTTSASKIQMSEAKTNQISEPKTGANSETQNFGSTTDQKLLIQQPSTKQACSNVENPKLTSAMAIAAAQIQKDTDPSVISASAKLVKGVVPTVEISVLPENPQSQLSNGSSSNNNNNQHGPQYNLSKRYLFRIKPGHGFVCEACRKFTQDEVIFRRHVWDHFHTVTRSCKFCTPDHVRRKDFFNCSLVNNVVCSLVKKSANQKKTDARENSSEKTISVVDDEVIAISDDDEEEEGSKKKYAADDKEEIIVVDDDPPLKQSTEVKLTAFSLSDSNTLKKEQFKKCFSEEITDIDQARNSEHHKSSDRNDGAVLKTEKAKFSDAATKENSKAKNSEKDRHSDDVEDTGIINKVIDKENRCFEKQIEKGRDKTENTGFVEESLNSTDKTPDESEGKCFEKSSSENLSDISRVASKKFERHVLSSCKSSAYYMCGFDQCSFTSLTSQKYKTHLSSNHTGAYNYVCCHCGLKNYTEDAHIRHINSHSNVKVFLLFNCPFNPCRYKTNLIHMFREHVVSHKENGVKCTYCHKNFESADSLVQHLKSNLIKYVSCPHCHFKFQLKDTVTKHIRLAHPDKHRIVTVSSQVVCLERELNFYSAPLAKTMNGERRQNSLEGASLPVQPNEVDASDFLSASESSLENRTQSIVNIPSEGDSELPDKLLASSPPVLIAEVSSNRDQSGSGNDSEKHNPEAPRCLLCSRCNFISWNYKLHLQHLSLHETDEPEREKRFVCMYCPKGFDGLNPFKTHVSNHVGKHEFKIYGCTLCVFTTSQKYHIMDHCKDNHLGTGTYFEKNEIVVSKEASCRFCEFKSRQAEQVQLHEKVVHLNPASKQRNEEELKTQSEEISSSSQLTEESAETSESSDQTQKFRKYHCHYCMNQFKHKADLREHMKASHLDIESKSFVTFKCKYCHFTSTMKNLIINHIERKHGNEPVRILRRIENIDSEKSASEEVERRQQRNEDKTIYRCEICDVSMESSEKFKKHFTDKHANYDSDDKEFVNEQKEKETLFIPDGNTFKEAVQCPKCSYSNKLRVNILRHIKEHPELVPSRHPVKADKSPSKMTARKSTGKNQSLAEDKKHKNPFAAVKDAVRELDRADIDNSKLLEQLALGGDFLHRKLSSCFIPQEKDFKCKICKCNIAKKFVLHKHILNHLQITFFKCHYCSKGDIEQSLLSGHIQQEHSLKPIKFDFLDLNEIASQIEDQIREQTFKTNIPHNIHEISDNSQSSDDVNAEIGRAEKQSQEADSRADNYESDVCVYKCSRCDYTTRKQDHLLNHRKTHMNPTEKKFGCSVCSYRALIKSHVMKHMKKMHPMEPMKYKVFANNSETTVSENTSTNEDAQPDTISTVGNDEEGSQDSSKISKKVSVKHENISDAGVFEIKTVYKCKECGEKKLSKSGIYKHLKSTKCHKPWYQCQACAFTNQHKNAITQHAKKRHAGRKVGIVELPLSQKIRLIKTRFKQDDQSLKNVQGNSNISQNNESEVHSCKICNNYKSESLSKLQFHINTKHEGKPLLCLECDYKTPLVKHIINHCSDLHQMKIAKYTTQNKDKTNKDKAKSGDDSGSNSLKSKGSNPGLKKFKCLNCNISKKTLKTLRGHMQSHFEYKPFVCKYCSSRLQHFQNVKRHITDVHAGKTIKYSMIKDEKIEKKLDEMIEQVQEQREKEVEKTVRMIKSKSVKRQCETDDKILPKQKKRPVIETDEETSQDESETETSVRYRVSREPGTNAKVFQCVECDFKTNRKESLHGHLRKHGKKDSRTNVSKQAKSTQKGKQSHKREELPPTKRAKLMDDDSFEESSSGNKERHKTLDEFETGADWIETPFAVATNESMSSEASRRKIMPLRYYCNVCDFNITGLYHFRQHLAKHSEFTYLQRGSDIESRLSCGYCSYVAVDDADFSNHIGNHLDERPFRCGHCEHSGFHRSSIQQHIANAHPGEVEVILDKRETPGERLKVKQVMLVDFDPQIALERLETSGNREKVMDGVLKLRNNAIIQTKTAVVSSVNKDEIVTASHKTESAFKTEKKIVNLFSLMSKEQKKVLPPSKPKVSAENKSGKDTKLNSDSLSVTSISKDQTEDRVSDKVNIEKETQNQDDSRNNSEKTQASPKLKTVSFTIPSPVKSLGLKTVSLKVPSPEQLSMSLDRPGEHRENENKGSKSKENKENSDEDRETDTNKSYDTKDLSDGLRGISEDFSKKLDEENSEDDVQNNEKSSEPVGENTDKNMDLDTSKLETKQHKIYMNNMSKGSDKMHVVEEQNDQMVKLPDKLCSKGSNLNNNISGDGHNSKESDRSLTDCSLVAELEIDSSRTEESYSSVFPKLTSESSVKGDDNLLERVNCHEDTDSNDSGSEKNDTNNLLDADQMETESTYGSKDENIIEKQKHTELESKSSKEVTVQEFEHPDLGINTDESEETSNNDNETNQEIHKGEDYISESQGFEVFDESKTFDESESATVKDSEIQDAAQLMQTQPFDYDRKMDKESIDPQDENFNYKSEEEDRQNKRIEKGSQVSQMSDMNSNNSVVGALQGKDETKHRETDATFISSHSASVSDTFISSFNENHEEEGHEDILSKIDSVLLEGKGKIKTLKELHPSKLVEDDSSVSGLFPDKENGLSSKTDSENFNPTKMKIVEECTEGKQDTVDCENEKQNEEMESEVSNKDTVDCENEKQNEEMESEVSNKD